MNEIDKMYEILKELSPTKLGYSMLCELYYKKTTFMCPTNQGHELIKLPNIHREKEKLKGITIGTIELRGMTKSAWVYWYGNKSEEEPTYEQKVIALNEDILKYIKDIHRRQVKLRDMYKP